ncbi:hypothetical protein [Streptomyces syringium]|uniref:hypothetical protein n=1 Tax=Streptomyces syringium TaxID=76729 RepID=UPI003AAAFDEA
MSCTDAVVGWPGDRRAEGHDLDALGLVVNAATLWTTRHLNAAVENCGRCPPPPDDDDGGPD